MDKLVEICRWLGGRVPHWIQGKGGNVSVKEGNRLWIKASGAHVSDVSASHGVACVDLLRFNDLRQGAPPADAEGWYAETLTRCATGHARPSMETGFHALLPGAWVVHVHSLAAIVMAHEHERDAAALNAFFAAHAPLAVSFVPPELPGWNLSTRLTAVANAGAIVLANHGVIVQGDDPAGLIASWTRVEEAFCAEWGCRELVAFGTRMADADLAGQPFRAYFPDAVVFQEAVEAAARRAHGAPPPASRDAQDALEILEAIALLERACPDLGEIGSDQRAAIPALPTEAFRKA